MPATTDPPENQGDGRTRSRLESEIEEILERAEREHPMPPPLSLEEARKDREKRERSSQHREQLRAVGQTAHHMLTAAPIVVSFMFAIIAMMVSDFSPFLARTAVSAAVIAYFFPIADYYRSRNSGGGSSSRMWRGRDMGPPPTEPTPFEQLRDWFRNRRNMP